MTVVGCDLFNGNDNNSDDGKFTLNNIPAEFNGKYAFFSGAGETGTEFYGYQSMSAGVYTLCLISNGSVSIPTWTENTSGNRIRYSGNDNITLKGYIFGSQTVPEGVSNDLIIGVFRPTAPVAFTNGSATKSWSDVDYYPAE